MYINSCVIVDPALILYVGFENQLVSLLGRNGNISLLGEKTVLQRNVFMIEGPEKGNGVFASQWATGNKMR